MKAAKWFLWTVKTLHWQKNVWYKGVTNFGSLPWSHPSANWWMDVIQAGFLFAVHSPNVKDLAENSRLHFFQEKAGRQAWEIQAIFLKGCSTGQLLNTLSTWHKNSRGIIWGCAYEILDGLDEVFHAWQSLKSLLHFL